MSWLDLYSRFRAVGQLPEPGEWGDQPAVVGEAFMMLEVATIQQQQADQKAALSKAKPTPMEED